MNQYKPQEVGIELVKGCNFSCQMCPVPLYRDDVAWQFMSLDLVEKIVAEIEVNDSVTTIWLAHLGEPLAHPQLRDCLNIISRVHRKFKRRVILHTNGSLLQKEKVDALLETDTVTELTLSFDGFGDKASFEFLRGKHFDKVLRNISAFSQQAATKRADLKILTCSVMPKKSEMKGWQGVFPDASEVEDNFKRLFKPLGIGVQYRSMIDFSGNETLPIAGSKQERIFGGCHFIEKDSLYFAATGKAQPCCIVFNDEFNVGSIQEQSFDNLLNNKSMEKLRHTLRMDERDELPFCHNCSLSTGGDLSPSHFQQFWIDRHDNYPLTTEEQVHIFGLMPPTTMNNAQLLLNMLQNRVNINKSSITTAPVGCIDSIQFFLGHLTINAWVADEHDGSPLTLFKVFIDDESWNINNIIYLIRDDVAKHWGKKEWLFSGIKLELTGVPKGEHTVKLEVKNSAGLSTIFVETIGAADIL